MMSRFVHLAIVSLPFFIAPAIGAGGEGISTEAARIHKEAITIDTHVDIAGKEYATEALDPGIDHPKLRCDLVKMERGGLDAVFLAVWIRQGQCDATGYEHAYDTAIKKFAAIHRLTETMHPDRCELALSPDDVERITKILRPWGSVHHPEP